MRNQPRQAHRNRNPASDCSLSAEEANVEKEQARKVGADGLSIQSSRLKR